MTIYDHAGLDSQPLVGYTSSELHRNLNLEPQVGRVEDGTLSFRADSEQKSQNDLIQKPQESASTEEDVKIEKGTTTPISHHVSSFLYESDCESDWDDLYISRVNELDQLKKAMATKPQQSDRQHQEPPSADYGGEVLALKNEVSKLARLLKNAYYALDICKSRLDDNDYEELDQRQESFRKETMDAFDKLREEDATLAEDVDSLKTKLIDMEFEVECLEDSQVQLESEFAKMDKDFAANLQLQNVKSESQAEDAKANEAKLEAIKQRAEDEMKKVHERIDKVVGDYELRFGSYARFDSAIDMFNQDLDNIRQAAIDRSETVQKELQASIDRQQETLDLVLSKLATLETPAQRDMSRLVVLQQEEDAANFERVAKLFISTGSDSSETIDSMASGTADSKTSSAKPEEEALKDADDVPIEFLASDPDTSSTKFDILPDSAKDSNPVRNDHASLLRSILSKSSTSGKPLTRAEIWDLPYEARKTTEDTKPGDKPEPSKLEQDPDTVAQKWNTISPEDDSDSEANIPVDYLPDWDSIAPTKNDPPTNSTNSDTSQKLTDFQVPKSNIFQKLTDLQSSKSDIAQKLTDFQSPESDISQKPTDLQIPKGEFGPNSEFGLMWKRAESQGIGQAEAKVDERFFSKPKKASTEKLQRIFKQKKKAKDSSNANTETPNISFAEAKPFNVDITTYPVPKSSSLIPDDLTTGDHFL